MTNYSALQVECQRLLKEINAAILAQDWNTATWATWMLEEQVVYLARALYSKSRLGRIQDDYELTEQLEDKH